MIENFAVSVIVAAYNEEKYLNEALCSILLQSGLSFELIFVDDHSTDSTLIIAEELSKKYPILKVYKNPRKGKCSAFNFGVSLAKGRFVCIFAGDDIMPEGSLKERYMMFQNKSDDDYLVGLSKLITMSDIKKYNGHIIPKARGKGNLSGVSPMMNMRAANIIFPTPEDLPNEDTWMELAVLYFSGWQIIHGDIICCKWRMHDGNSLNMTLPFNEYNKRITVRMNALKLFMLRFNDILIGEKRVALQNRILVEEARRRGSVFGILFCKADLITKLRALSTTNSILYSLRVRMYGLLSGW